MKKAFSEGCHVFVNSIKFFCKHPVSIVPLTICWLVYGGAILYFEYGFDWDRYPGGLNFWIVFGSYVAFSFLFGAACLIVLEMLQQLSAGNKISLTRAVYDALIKGFWKAVPILLVWAVMWFVLMLLEVIFSKKKEKSGQQEFSAKAAVGTLLGADQQLSLSSAFFSALSKGVRMTTFLILPAVAWEDLPPIKAYKKGLTVLKDLKAQFLVAYGLTEIFALFVLFAPAIIYYADNELGLALPAVFWCIVLIYMTFATSLIFLVEQLYVAELYLWHMTWEKDSQLLIGAGKKPKKLKDSRRPDLF